MTAMQGSCAHSSGPNFFVRYGPDGRTVGPFKHRHTAYAWLELRGFKREHEGATFKVYEAEAPGTLRLG